MKKTIRFKYRDAVYAAAAGETVDGEAEVRKRAGKCAVILGSTIDCATQDLLVDVDVPDSPEGLLL